MVLYKFLVDEAKCMNCGACMDLCPAGCLEFTRTLDVEFYGDLYSGQPMDQFGEGLPKIGMMEKPYLPFQERCTGCQVCVRECPTNAIRCEPDTDKSAATRPKPVFLKAEAKEADDGHWHPLSAYTTDYLKRPIRSPWSKVAEWRPTIKERGVTQTWRTMEQE